MKNIQTPLDPMIEQMKKYQSILAKFMNMAVKLGADENYLSLHNAMLKIEGSVEKFQRASERAKGLGYSSLEVALNDLERRQKRDPIDRLEEFKRTHGWD